jgi:hypothetical protein
MHEAGRMSSSSLLLVFWETKAQRRADRPRSWEVDVVPGYCEAEMYADISAPTAPSSAPERGLSGHLDTMH